MLSSEISYHFHGTSFKANKFPHDVSPIFILFQLFMTSGVVGNNEFYFLVILDFP